MRSRRTCLAVLLALALTGCSAMLEREYQSVTPHVRVSVAEDDSDAVWVETYSELQSAILAQVKAGEEVGVVRLRNWQSDVEDASPGPATRSATTTPWGPTPWTASSTPTSAW